MIDYLNLIRCVQDAVFIDGMILHQVHMQIADHDTQTWGTVVTGLRPPTTRIVTTNANVHDVY